MEFLVTAAWIYALLSVVVGVVICTWTVFRHREYILNDMRSVERKFLEDKVKKGHLQIEEYEGREAYLEKDIEGEAAMSTARRVRSMQKNRPILLLFLVWITGSVTCTLQWPFMLYDEIRKKT